MSENVGGDTFYVDFERIRKRDGFVYYWILVDYLVPTKTSMLSGKLYKQGDCHLFRFKYLSFVFHKQSMGSDTGISDTPKNPQWDYPHPDSVFESILKEVCNR